MNEPVERKDRPPISDDGDDSLSGAVGAPLPEHPPEIVNSITIVIRMNENLTSRSPSFINAGIYQHNYSILAGVIKRSVAALLSKIEIFAYRLRHLTRLSQVLRCNLQKRSLKKIVAVAEKLQRNVKDFYQSPLDIYVIPAKARIHFSFIDYSVW